MKKQTDIKTDGENKAKGGEQNTHNSRKTGRTPKEVVDEHIKNEKDVISDEEFKNLNLNLGVVGDVTHEPLAIPDNKNRPKDEDKDHRKITPWDVIE